MEREGTSANIQGQQLVAVMGEIFERYKELVATRPNMAVVRGLYPFWKGVLVCFLYSG